MDKDKPRASLGYLWCIEDNWKLILWYDGQIEGIGVSTPSEMRKKPVRLYSLEKDPHEKDNQAANHPVLVKRLQKEIEAWYPLGERRTLGSND